MVFQSYAIWPHMTVFQNVAYPLAKEASRAEIGERVARILDRLSLGALADRLAPNLSGGQQQRVALARALVAQPQVLLFDEPLSNLDAKLREQMRFELKALQESFGITTVYVTHDQEEALALSDRIGLMHEGALLEVGRRRTFTCVRRIASPLISLAPRILFRRKLNETATNRGMKCWWRRHWVHSSRSAASNGNREWRRNCSFGRSASICATKSRAQATGRITAREWWSGSRFLAIRRTS